MSRMRTTSLALALVWACTPDLAAHGGQYRGPEDIVPPNPGGGRGTARGSRPNSPMPNAPSTPGASNPTTPGNGAPGTPGGGGGIGARTPHTGRGAALEPDLTRWSFWWELNKDPFLRLKDAVHREQVTTLGEDIYLGNQRRETARDTLAPTSTIIIQEILPALKRALESTDDRDITSSCLVAMAKIGANHPTFRVLPLFEARLQSKDQETRETAAIALGISQMSEAMPTLQHLASDTPQGRSLTDRGEVDSRTRSFACYGIGLIAHASSNIDLKRSAFDTLAQLIESTDRNLSVAAINGVRLIRTRSDVAGKELTLRRDMLAALWSYYEKPLAQGDQQVQAHVPPAIATILGRGGDTTGVFKQRFAGELDGKYGKRNINIYQSAALALGQLCTSDSADEVYCKLLHDYAGNGRDTQARCFSLMALADIGGNDNRNRLLTWLEKGRDQEKAWSALALGVLSFHARLADPRAEVDTTIERALRAVLSDEKNDEVLSAVAVGLGLGRCTAAAADLRQLLERYKRRDEFAGYLGIGLALMGDAAAKEPLRALAASSIRRPGLLGQAAVALGLLGDKQVANDLCAMLAAPDKNVAKLSALASALGLIGDRRSIKPLVTMLFDPSITELSRAFAAVALGGIADKEALPWNSKIAVGLNYRAAVETLTNMSSGILDIL